MYSWGSATGVQCGDVKLGQDLSNEVGVVVGTDEGIVGEIGVNEGTEGAGGWDSDSLVGSLGAGVVTGEVDVGNRLGDSSEVNSGTIGLVATVTESSILGSEVTRVGLLEHILKLGKGDFLEALTIGSLESGTSISIDFSTESGDIGGVGSTIEGANIVIGGSLSQVTDGFDLSWLLRGAELWEPVAEFSTVGRIPVTVVVAGRWVPAAVSLSAVPV